MNILTMAKISCFIILVFTVSSCKKKQEFFLTDNINELQNPLMEGREIIVHNYSEFWKLIQSDSIISVGCKVKDLENFSEKTTEQEFCSKIRLIKGDKKANFPGSVASKTGAESLPILSGRNFNLTSFTWTTASWPAKRNSLGNFSTWYFSSYFLEFVRLTNGSASVAMKNIYYDDPLSDYAAKNILPSIDRLFIPAYHVDVAFDELPSFGTKIYKWTIGVSNGNYKTSWDYTNNAYNTTPPSGEPFFKGRIEGTISSDFNGKITSMQASSSSQAECYVNTSNNCGVVKSGGWSFSINGEGRISNLTLISKVGQSPLIVSANDLFSSGYKQMNVKTIYDYRPYHFVPEFGFNNGSIRGSFQLGLTSSKWGQYAISLGYDQGMQAGFQFSIDGY